MTLPKIILGSGSREWRNPTPIRKVFAGVLQEFGKDFKYFHGAQRGFDEYSDAVLRRMGFFNIQPFKANWNLYGNAAGPIRNQEMLDSSLTYCSAADILLIAMPLPSSIGTYRMIEICEKAGIEVRVYNEVGILV